MLYVVDKRKLKNKRKLYEETKERTERGGGGGGMIVFRDDDYILSTTRLVNSNLQPGGKGVVAVEQCTHFLLCLVNHEYT